MGRPPPRRARAYRVHTPEWTGIVLVRPRPEAEDDLAVVVRAPPSLRQFLGAPLRALQGYCRHQGYFCEPVDRDAR